MILAITPPPSVNHLYPTGRDGIRRKSREYRTWIGASLWEIKIQHPEALHGCVTISLTVPENGRRDLDGYAKACLDLLVTAGLIDGDSFKTVKELHLYWHKQPALVVEIVSWPVGPITSKPSARRRGARLGGDVSNSMPL